MKNVKFSTDESPIRINIEFDLFVSYLKKYVNGNNQVLENILSALDPTIKYWSSLLEKKKYYDDFTIYSVCKFLNSDNKPIGTVKEKIKIYLQYNRRSEISVESDIALLFCEFFKKKTIHKNGIYIKPLKLFFHIAMEMKYLIFTHIRKIVQLCKRDLYFHKESLYFDYQDESYEESYDIIYIFNQIDSISLWHSYLFKLILHGFSVKERCKLLYLTPIELHKEENLIWQLLKQKQLDNLIQLDQT